MKLHKELEQGTTEWLRMKWGRIGGTRSKGLFVDSDTLFNNLLVEHLEQYDEDEIGYISDAMADGIEKEPEAREVASNVLGLEFMEVGWIQSDINILGISPDGLTPDLEIGLELKCPKGLKHIKTVLSDAVPDDNIFQCVHYFTVNPKLKKLYFGSYRPENQAKPFFYKLIDLNTQVNIGTKAKPILKSVSEMTEIARKNAKDIEQRIIKTVNNLTF